MELIEHPPAPGEQPLASIAVFAGLGTISPHVFRIRALER